LGSLALEALKFQHLRLQFGDTALVDAARKIVHDDIVFRMWPGSRMWRRRSLKLPGILGHESMRWPSGVMD
jgi:hypothetical protein